MNAKTKYYISIILQIVTMIIPCVFGILFCKFSFGTKIVEEQAQFGGTIQTVVRNTPNIPLGVLFAVSFVLFLALRKPLKKMYSEGVRGSEYDEFGRSKKKSFDNLTRQEREQMDLQKTMDMERLISSSVIDKITKKGSENTEKDLNSMIGINSVKTKLTEMKARMEFEQLKEIEENGGKKPKKKKANLGSSSMSGRHLCFFGRAGTGKTTVARIITGFLYEYGYIPQNKIIEVDGNFLKAGNESATKVKYITQLAYGGVLFIDEAYSLKDDENAIATLIKEMEDNRDKFILIIAGYKNDMTQLLDRNEGFKSRIKEYLDFPDYSIEEMKQIFMGMAQTNNFLVSSDALDNLEIRLAKEIKLSSFANGRTVRNVLDEAIDKHSINYMQKSIYEYDSNGELITDNKYKICANDVSTALSTRL